MKKLKFITLGETLKRRAERLVLVQKPRDGVV